MITLTYLGGKCSVLDGQTCVRGGEGGGEEGTRREEGHDLLGCGSCSWEGGREGGVDTPWRKESNKVKIPKKEAKRDRTTALLRKRRID